MGLSAKRSFSAPTFGAHVANLPAAVARRAVAEEIIDARDNVLDAGRESTGGSGKLRNAGPDNVLGADARVNADGLGGQLTAEGPWPLIEGDTKAHEIAAKSGRALRLPNGPRRRVEHPGTRGKKPWAKGIAKSERGAAQVLRRASDTEIRKL